MKYLKPMNYVRSCLLFGCLFSFKVLASPQVSVEEESIYIYELDIENINFGETVVVDPLNPTVEVEPLPPTYTPRNNTAERIKNNYSTSPPNGEIPILIQKNSKKFLSVKTMELRKMSLYCLLAEVEVVLIIQRCCIWKNSI